MSAHNHLKLHSQGIQCPQTQAKQPCLVKKHVLLNELLELLLCNINNLPVIIYLNKWQVSVQIVLIQLQNVKASLEICYIHGLLLRCEDHTEILLFSSAFKTTI